MPDSPSLPPEWDSIETLDTHAGGEPLRIVTSSIPDLTGETMLARREQMQAEFDHLRTRLVYEPRGHQDMYGAILTDPVSPAGDVGVLFCHNDGYSTMCGHGIIALGTALPETGLISVEQARAGLVFDTPAGPVPTTPVITNDRVEAVTFENVPSFVSRRDHTVDVPEFGRVNYDIAFGGAFYAYVDVEEVGLSLSPTNVAGLIDAGMTIKQAIATTESITHPSNDELGYLYGTIFTGPPRSETADTRNVCIFADGQVDRSPTGTGVSGRLALLHDRDELEPNESLTVESIIDTTFRGRIADTTLVGDTPAIIPTVTGHAHITGRHEYVHDPQDPLVDGFLLR